MCNSLYLSPTKNAELGVSPVTVIEALREIGLIGQPLDAPPPPGVRRYRAGDGFARHIVFAGCSPHLRYEPHRPGDLCFCHVGIHGPWNAPRLVTGPHTTPPRCPACGQRFPGWRKDLPDWQNAGLDCCGCNARWVPTELDWRRYAASGTFLIELRNVFPGEALPGDQLIQTLERCSARPWTYAWSEAL